MVVRTIEMEPNADILENIVKDVENTLIPTDIYEDFKERNFDVCYYIESLSSKIENYHDISQCDANCPICDKMTALHENMKLRNAPKKRNKIRPDLNLMDTPFWKNNEVKKIQYLLTYEDVRDDTAPYFIADTIFIQTIEEFHQIIENQLEEVKKKTFVGCIFVHYLVENEQKMKWQMLPLTSYSNSDMYLNDVSF